MENVRAIYPYLCSLFLLLFPTTCEGGVYFVGFWGNETGIETREISSEYLYILTSRITTQDILTCTHKEDITPNILSGAIDTSYLYNLDTMTTTNGHDENDVPRQGGMTVLSSDWPGTQQASHYPKNVVPRD